MGGAVSSGRDNDELIDNLMGGNYIRTRNVERVFRALDRAEYMTPETRDQAYKDLAWRNGPLHLSAPCIYSEVMENLKLRPGLSFLNIGSGTGYLSTLVGLILGSSGISHGVEVRQFVVDYANKKLSQFLENSPALDEFDFCEPKFYVGNGLCLAPLQTPYDRVYCGAGCPEEYENYFKQLIKIGGILVMPLNDKLVQVQRVSETEWNSRMLLNVSFAPLREPVKNSNEELIKLDEQSPPRLQVLARAVVRAAMRGGLMRRHPELREPPPRQPPAKKSCPRRICIPIEDESDVEGLNALHDLDRNSGANEMNALLSLVLSMGQNRVAGALRFDTRDTSSDSSSDNDERRQEDDDDDDDDDDGDAGDGSDQALDLSGNLDEENLENSPREGHRGLLTFEFRNSAGADDDDDVTGPPLPPPPDDKTGAKKTDNKTRDESQKPEDHGDSNDNPNVPAEVEIYLGKSSEAAASTSKDGEMEWEEEGTAAQDPFSDEETTEDCSKSKEEKRQKLDSGIGENSPNSSSPAKTDTKTDESDADGSRRSDSLTDDVDDDKYSGRRRLQKRSRGSAGARSSSGERWSEPDADAGARRRRKRRAGPAPRARSPPRAPHDAADARRVRLSLCMKRGVKELPLPHALKKYVNLQRCFEF